MKKHQNKTVALPKSFRSHLLAEGMKANRYATLLRYIQDNTVVYSIQPKEMEMLLKAARLMVAEANRLESLIQKRNKSHDSTS